MELNTRIASFKSFQVQSVRSLRLSDQREGRLRGDTANVVLLGDQNVAVVTPVGRPCCLSEREEEVWLVRSNGRSSSVKESLEDS